MANNTDQQVNEAINMWCASQAMDVSGRTIVVTVVIALAGFLFLGSKYM